jgi:DNA-binding CsgD family transcriptional regulator
MSDDVHLTRVAFDAQQAHAAGRRLFMCRHHGRSAHVSLAEIAARHDLDIALQEKYNLRWLTYYVGAEGGTIFCLAEAPSQEAVEACHREAHGAPRAYHVAEVDWSTVEAFFGDVLAPDQGYPWAESPTRTIAAFSIANPLGLALRAGERHVRQVFDELQVLAAGAMGIADASQVERTPGAIIASFASSGRAVESAVGIVEHMAHVAPVRAGLSVGEPLSTRGSLFGATVQLAYELSLHAAPGAVLVSGAICDRCLGKGLAFAEHGTLDLDGFGVVRIAVAGRGSETQVAELSERECAVLRLIAVGQSDVEIARELVIDPDSVARHVADILCKTGASNLTEAVAFGYRERLFGREPAGARRGTPLDPGSR